MGLNIVFMDWKIGLMFCRFEDVTIVQNFVKYDDVYQKQCVCVCVTFGKRSLYTWFIMTISLS